MGTDLYLEQHRLGRDDWEDNDYSDVMRKKFFSQGPIEVSPTLAQKIQRLVAACEDVRKIYGDQMQRHPNSPLAKMGDALDDLYST